MGAALLVVALLAFFAARYWSGNNVVSRREYEQLREGMTLQEVQRIVGDNGKALSGGTGSRIYSWQNGNGSNVIVTFDGGAVSGKSQVGLQ